MSDDAKVGDGQFPRTAELPKQSPMFWVRQKDRYLRQLAIRDIEAITGRRLVVYFANRLTDTQIDQRDPAFFAEVLGDTSGEPVDLLLETNGGQTDATEALVSLLKNTVPDLRVIVANAAKSNGTLLALGAKSIVMGATSELGPIDPSIAGTPCAIWSSQPIMQQNPAMGQLALLAIAQTKDLATKLLSDGMMSGKESTHIQAVIEALATRNKYYSHGSVIDYKEAKQLGLVVEYLSPDDDLWQRIWLLYCMYEYDCRREGYMKIFEGRSRSTAVAPEQVASA